MHCNIDVMINIRAMHRRAGINYTRRKDEILNFTPHRSRG